MEDTARDRMGRTIRAWIEELESYPGWRGWQRKRLRHTMYFDDPFSELAQETLGDFSFLDEVEKQHAVVLGYLRLSETINALKECEYYFRRYPFRGLPVSRHSHITNVCEMYFGRFYEFRERLKKYLNDVAELAPNASFNVGAYVKGFDREFGRELRARHSVHHWQRFEDITIDRVFLTEIISTDDRVGKREHLAAYRKLANEWAWRVRQRGQRMDQFLEAVAEATLANCSFLADLLAANLPTR
jgi:hypothetical protein